MKKNNCDFKSCFFCQLCLPEWIPALETHRKNLHFKKGELLFSEGEKVVGMYFVNSGIVKVHKKWGEEKELIIRFAGKGAILGHRGLGGDNYYPISATALEPITVCFFDLDFFTASLKVNHELTYKLMLFYAEELQESERRMRNMAHMSVKGRLAYALYLLQKRFNKTEEGFIGITLSKQDLASYVGATYETVFRTLSELNADKIITLSGKNISITNETKLKGLGGLTK